MAACTIMDKRMEAHIKCDEAQYMRMSNALGRHLGKRSIGEFCRFLSSAKRSLSLVKNQGSWGYLRKQLPAW